jgi:hypothetical protein
LIFHKAVPKTFFDAARLTCFRPGCHQVFSPDDFLETFARQNLPDAPALAMLAKIKLRHEKKFTARLVLRGRGDDGAGG